MRGLRRREFGGVQDTAGFGRPVFASGPLEINGFSARDAFQRDAIGHGLPELWSCRLVGVPPDFGEHP